MLKNIFTVTICLLTIGFISHAQAEDQPQLALNKHNICPLYLQEHTRQFYSISAINYKAALQSIYAAELKNTADNSSKTTEITFSEPLNIEGANWLRWTIIPGFKHDATLEGLATAVVARGSYSPSPDAALLIELYTIGERGPYFQIRLANKATVDPLIQDAVTNTKGAVDIYRLRGTKLLPNENNLFEHNGEIFFIDKNNALKQINPNGTVQTRCKLKKPKVLKTMQSTAYAEIVNRSIMTEPITHGHMPYGTSGSGLFKVKNPFDRALTRPWALPVNKDGSCRGSEDICVRKQYIDTILHRFSQTDSWSARELATLRNHMRGAAYDFQRYFMDRYGYDETYAAALGDYTTYELLEKIFRRYRYSGYKYDDTLTNLNSTYVLDDLPRKTNAAIATLLKHKNSYNKTPLMLAAHFNDYTIVDFLIKQGVAVNAVTKNVPGALYNGFQRINRSALTYAAENAALEVIKLLVDAGADLALKDSEGNDLSYYLLKNPRENVRALAENLAGLRDQEKSKIQPSFDCGTATTRYDMAICNSRGLSLYDRELGAHYTKLLENLQLPYLRDTQRQWLKQIRKSCGQDPRDHIVSCFKKKYRARIRFFENLLAAQKP